jgi:hypothetical protein
VRVGSWWKVRVGEGSRSRGRRAALAADDMIHWMKEKEMKGRVRMGGRGGAFMDVEMQS